jgi:divalent metal cation (Fe/Co/Zn/Cd) transporter
MNRDRTLKVALVAIGSILGLSYSLLIAGDLAAGIIIVFLGIIWIRLQILTDAVAELRDGPPSADQPVHSDD